jgi:AraC-like DNA-binding protein
LFGLGHGPVPPGTLRLVGYALISSNDLGVVCRRLGQISPALPALPTIEVEVGEPTTRLCVRTDAGSGHLLTDFLLVILHRFAGWLIGRRIPLRAVAVPYSQPEFAHEYDLIFGAPVSFDAPAASLEFDTSLLSQPVVRDDQELLRYLRHSPADLLARRDYGTTLAEQSRRILERGLRGDWPGSDEVARRLTMSTQHLRRRLREEGTSLGRIREEILRDAAISALRRGDPVDQLSTRLGFSEASAFRRAFKRWTGSTPAAYQR